MDKVKGAFAKHDQVVEDFVEGARLDVGLEAMCALEEDEEWTLRELMVAVHVEACEDFTVDHAVEHTDKHDCVMTQCGDGWDCPQALALKELAKEA